MEDWRHEDRKYRVFISDESLLSLFLDYREFEMIRVPEHIPIEFQGGLNCLYLLEMDSDDETLFTYFGATIENYTAQ